MTALLDVGIGPSLANAVDYVMTTAQAAAVVGLTRASTSAKEFSIPRQNTSRRLLGHSDLHVDYTDQQPLFFNMGRQPNRHLLAESFDGLEGQRSGGSGLGGSRGLRQTAPALAPAPAAIFDNTILDAVVQLTVITCRSTAVQNVIIQPCPVCWASKACRAINCTDRPEFLQTEAFEVLLTTQVLTMPIFGHCIYL